MTEPHNQPRPNKTDAGNGSKAICRVSNVLRSPSPDPKRSPNFEASSTMCRPLIAFALVLLTACCATPQAPVSSSARLVTFAAHCIPPEDTPAVYDTHTIHRLLRSRCITSYEFDLNTGVPHSEVTKHSDLYRTILRHKSTFSLSCRVLGPEWLDDTVPPFYQKVGAIDSFYIVRRSLSGKIEHVIPYTGRKRWKIDDLFRSCQAGDTIVAQWIF